MAARLVTLCVCFISFWYTPDSQAQVRDGISPESDSKALVELWRVADYFDDMTGELGLKQVMRHDFKPLRAHPQFGQTTSHFWLKVDLSSLYKSETSLAFHFDNPIIDNIVIYKVDRENRETHIEHLGDLTAFDQRPYPYRSFILPFVYQPGDIYYVEIWGLSPIMLPSFVGPESDVFQRALKSTAFSFFVSGVILCMLLYNLFLFIGTRISVYGWYVIYVASIWFYTLFTTGIGFQYIWSGSAEVQNCIAYFFIAGFQWASVNFTRRFLQTQSYYPNIDRWLSRLSFIPLIALFSIFIDIGLLVRILSLITLCIVVMVPTVSIAIWRKGFKASAIFLFSWLFVICGMLIYNVGLLGGLPITFITLHALELGVAIESVLLSFALAYRIRSMEKANREKEVEVRQNLEKAYAETESALSMAKASNEAKNAFLSNISHNVKTPIHAFYGNIQLLSGSELNQAQRERIEAAKDNAMQLFFYMDNLLTYSEILGNDIVSIEQKANIRGEVDELVESWQRNNSGESRVINTNYDSDIPSTVFAEWIHIRKVLRVLFDSLLPASNSEFATLNVMSDMDGTEGAVTFEITDLQIQELSILDNWVKQEILANEWEGLGLEYFVGRKLIEVIGAYLSSVVENDGSSKLMFTFPCRIAKDEISTEARKDFPNVNVLVVDDNRVNIQVMCAMVEKLGASSDWAESGEDAVGKIKTGDYDVILMDCLMPGMSGQETAKRIRSQHSSNQNCPIIAVSANASDKDRESCIKSGMNDFMSKPVRLEKLAEYLTRWVPEY